MALSNGSAASYDPQSACPLFTQIPAEVRNHIFELALTEYDDASRPYERGSFHYRPGYHFRQRIDTDLLRTCRRVYLEANLLPVAINEHVFWCYRAPPGMKHASEPSQYFLKMTPQQQNAVDCVHFFTQQFWLEGQWDDACRIPEMRPRKIKITLRHADWWCWEYKEKLGIDPRLPGRVKWQEMGKEPGLDEIKRAWGYHFRHLRGLREFEMELETIESNKDQLDAIAQRGLAWKFDLCDGSVLSTEGTSLIEHSWKGVAPVEVSYWDADWDEEPDEEAYDGEDIGGDYDGEDYYHNGTDRDASDFDDAEAGEMTGGLDTSKDTAIGGQDFSGHLDVSDDPTNPVDMLDRHADQDAVLGSDPDLLEPDEIQEELLLEQTLATRSEEPQTATNKTLSYYVLKLTWRARAPASGMEQQNRKD
ncbi:MAG: hypothetical protein M1830_000705 [Pleopsidium flavum]|nr:MAG: hypothetical protein M1830_000705 [Pleopsidium flavum]